MHTLELMAVMLGGLLLALGGVGCVAPALARRGLAAFPRNRMLAWVLTAIVLGWCGMLVYHGPLGFLEAYREWLFVLVPLAVVLICVFVEELLAARALGGLLIMLPAPILEMARWHPSAWRYVPIFLAYAMVLAGAGLVTAPYLFRKAAERLTGDDGACRGSGAGLAVLGAGLVVLGVAVF